MSLGEAGAQAAAVIRNKVSLFAMAAPTNYHRCSGLKQHKSIIS